MPKIIDLKNEEAKFKAEAEATRKKKHREACARYIKKLTPEKIKETRLKNKLRMQRYRAAMSAEAKAKVRERERARQSKRKFTELMEKKKKQLLETEKTQQSDGGSTKAARKIRDQCTIMEAIHQQKAEPQWRRSQSPYMFQCQFPSCGKMFWDRNVCERHEEEEGKDINRLAKEGKISYHHCTK